MKHYQVWYIEEEEEEEDLCNGNNDSVQLKQELDQQMSRRTTMNPRSR
jgi:hypothetical protein